MRRLFSSARSIALILAAASCSSTTTAPPPTSLSPRDRITRADIEADVRYLASDELRGRRTGEPQAVVAAKWLAEQLKKSGLEPAGDGGTFLQRVPMEKSRKVAAPTLAWTNASGASAVASYGVEFDQANLTHAAKITKVVVVRSAEDLPPKPDASIALVLPGSRSERQALLDRAKTPHGEGWGLLVTLGPELPGSAAKEDSNWNLRVLDGGADAQRLRVRGPLREHFEKGEVQSLEFSASIETVAAEAYNVIGRIRGARDETIVVSAHYDHLGEDHREHAASSEKVDTIYNGADDDASGCATILELADACAHAAKPERTLLFFFATGEELGLLGTDWYVAHPIVPLEKTVLNLNFEMLGHPDPLVGGSGVMWLTGDERTNLGAAFREHGLAVQPDARPDEHFFERSDNISFVRKGVLGQTLSTFNTKTPYHQVGDEWQTLEYEHMQICARNSFDALALLASGAVTPSWIPGHEYKR